MKGEGEGGIWAREGERKNSHNNSRKTNSKSLPASIAIFENVCAKLARRSIKLLKWRDVDFNQSEQGIKSKIDISLILTNHYFYAQNLSVKNGQNNGVLAGVPFLSPSRARHALARAQILPSPSPFNAGPNSPFPFPFQRRPRRLGTGRSALQGNRCSVTTAGHGVLTTCWSPGQGGGCRECYSL